jgi:hypothetical protein
MKANLQQKITHNKQEISLQFQAGKENHSADMTSLRGWYWTKQQYGA